MDVIDTWCPVTSNLQQGSILEQKEELTPSEAHKMQMYVCSVKTFFELKILFNLRSVWSTIKVCLGLD